MDFPSGRLDLFMIDISEPRDNDLRVVVVVADDPGPFAPHDLGGGLIFEAREIKGGPASPVYEILWLDYVAYAVRNERFTTLAPGEDPKPDRLFTVTASPFLDYVAAATFATDDFPGPLTQWSLITQNHCLDVVSTEPPQVRRLERSEYPTSRLAIEHGLG